MKILLLETVPNLGKPGDTVEVKSGFYRNYLGPRKMAAAATATNMKIAEKRKLEAAKKAAEEKESAVLIAKQLESLEIKLSHKAGDKDQLFGSVTNQHIADYLKAKGFEIDKHKISLADPIKTLGTYEVKVKLHTEVTANLKVTVEKEEEK